MKIPKPTKLIFGALVKLLYGGNQPTPEEISELAKLVDGLLVFQLALMMNTYQKKEVIQLIKSQKSLTSEAKMSFIETVARFKLPN